MAVGIYISGLEHATDNETVEKYAARYVKELENATFNFKYYTKIEKIYYTATHSSYVIKIYEHDKNSEPSASDKLVYKLYDFEYHKELNQEYQSKNLFFKNSQLLFLVLKKIPKIVSNLLKKSTYKKGGKTFYMFFYFFIMSVAVLSLLPFLILFFDTLNAIANSDINFMQLVLKYCIVLTVSFMLFIPESNIILTKIAAEFILLDHYIYNKDQKEKIKNNLEHLIDYIVQQDVNKKIHFHTYSFGSIIALNSLFPVQSEPSENLLQKVNLLVTIGAPYEYIKNYYPNFYKDRNDYMTKKIQWINVYSLADAFASNFRYDNKAGEANYGILNTEETPININYEISQNTNHNVFDFLGLKKMYMHESYWDDSKSGASCTHLIYFKMREIGQWSVA